MNDLYPVISHSLGPSTLFSCPSVSRYTLEDEIEYCTTYAVIKSTSEIGHELSGRLIWYWKEPLKDGSSSAPLQTIEVNCLVLLPIFSQPRLAGQVPSQLSSMHLLEPLHLLFRTSGGDLLVTDQEGNIVVERENPKPNSKLHSMEIFLFSCIDCNFLPRTTPPRCTVIVLVSAGENVKIEVLAISLQDEAENVFTEIGDCTIELETDVG